ncbi:MAG: hypothetical protein ABIP89_20640, partial [Polyangiaceae bacterium]
IRVAARAAILVAPFACAVLAASSADAADNARSYGIANFGMPGQCGTPGMTHPVHVATAKAFTDQFFWMKQVQFWGTTSNTFNSGAGANLFTDPARQATCASNNNNVCSANDNTQAGIDNVAVSFVHTHAGHNPSSNSFFSMGNTSSGCNAATDTNFLLGDTATAGASEIAVMKACQGADLGVWQGGGYKKMVQNSSRFSMWNGFHGDSSCGGSTADYVADYAASSMVEGAGENWIDDAFDSDSSGDDCPVSIVFGNTKANRKAMFTHGGFGDRKLTNVSKSGSTYFFVSGCKPPVGTGVTLPTQ